MGIFFLFFFMIDNKLFEKWMTMKESLLKEHMITSEVLKELYTMDRFKNLVKDWIQSCTLKPVKL